MTYILYFLSYITPLNVSVYLNIFVRLFLQSITSIAPTINETPIIFLTNVSATICKTFNYIKFFTLDIYHLVQPDVEEVVVPYIYFSSFYCQAILLFPARLSMRELYSKKTIYNLNIDTNYNKILSHRIFLIVHSMIAVFPSS